METFVLVVVLVVLLIRWVVLSSRLNELRRRVNELDSERVSLKLRVSALEQIPSSVESGKMVAQASACESPAMRAAASNAPPTERPQPVQPVAPPPLPELRTTEPVAPPTPPPLPEPPAAFPAPAFAEEPAARLREKLSGAEWEAIVGGNWLNKLGVFILVIGIALFLGYSFTQFGPAGRAAIALGVSFAMLAAGFLIERRERYRIFARGLLGGGWAALYFTTYALHAVDAAKVIDNPLLGGALLLAVAAGMIAHSLRYRSQTVTGLAYFVAFATLAITSITSFSVIALVPLAGSLLFVAYRFEWSEMALFGLIATYGTCASRGDSGAPLWAAQTIFSVYWALFEAFDLFRTAQGSARTSERAILPLNALAFAGLSYAKWSAAAPHLLYALAAVMAVAYLASTALRVRLRPPSSFAPDVTTPGRIFAGGYEGPLTLAGILSAAAVLLKSHREWATAGLLTEGELLFLAGLLFGESYPRQVAAALFAGAVSKILGWDIAVGGAATVVGATFKTWTPVAAAASALFYLNRALRRSDQFYGYAGTGMLALIIGLESPERFVGMNWMLLGAAVFAFGWLRRLQDFRIQGYAAGVLGMFGIAIDQLNIAWGYSAASRRPWIALACAAALAYAAVICALRSAADRFSEAERGALRFAASWAAIVTLMVLVWRIAPSQYVGVGWLAVALAILELGIRESPAEFRRQSYWIATAGAVWILFGNAIPVQNNGPLADRLTIAFAALLAYAFAARVHAVSGAAIPQREAGSATNLASSAGTLFALTALWALLPAPAVAPAWAALALLLLETGFSSNLPGLRLQAHAAGAAAFGRLFLANFTDPGTTAGISHRLLTVVPIVAAHYHSWFRQRRESELQEWERQFARSYLYSAAILIAVLMRFELGRSLVAAGWALLALVLIACGEHWKNADLRWQSYAITAVAFFRSWTTDFYDPASLAGAPARIATGAFVIACFFAAQLLLPQTRPRLFYSLLSTVLLTILLYHEVSGSLLTVAWGAEGVALLIAGFPLRDRTLRLSGLALFMIGVLKLFLYDLRRLETMPRILSFIVLGLILVSVSWVYTRFRDQLQRYL